MNEPEIRIENRESLAYLLSEAAEIEHGLMCCYLYAAWSLAGPAASNVTPKQAAAMARWRETIIAVARDEMVHLANVSNLAHAIGATPHLLRANFPVSPGYHPAGVVVSLAPFSAATIDHFIYLERPEGVIRADGEGFAAARPYQRGGMPGRLVPSAQDYETVGHLYRGIRAGLGHLAESLGEDALFCGDPRLALGAPEVEMPGLSKVVDLESARFAIDTIVAQGEGTATQHESGHYVRFVAIADELRELCTEDPTFRPGSGVARNPVMRRPPTPEGLVWVHAEPAATILDVGNALYLLMLRSLQIAFSPVSLDAEIRALAVDAGITAMTCITPVAELLTQFPAGDEPLPRAGMTFTMTRGLQSLAEPRAALLAVSEVATAVASKLHEHVVPRAPSLAAVAQRIAQVAERLTTAAAARR